MNPDARPLPTGVFDLAMHSHLVLQQRRVIRMYNRVRALFAESVVAALLPGASVVEDPAAAWDIDWPARGRARPLRIQVKCSGERLPRFADPSVDHRAPARWEVRTPMSGYDPVEGASVADGEACDVLVLARHERWDIGAGWSFWVLHPNKVQGSASLVPRRLAGLGAVLCDQDVSPTPSASWPSAEGQPTADHVIGGWLVTREALLRPRPRDLRAVRPRGSGHGGVAPSGKHSDVRPKARPAARCGWAPAAGSATTLRHPVVILTVSDTWR